MPAARPQAVVFDLDGLMFNTEELYQDVGAEMLRRRGKTFEAELLDAMMGCPAAVALQRMIDWHPLDDTVARVGRRNRRALRRTARRAIGNYARPVPLLDQLEAAGLPKAIATSSGPAFVTPGFGKFQLQPRFQFVLTCDDVRHGKPHPEIYLLAAERLGLRPERDAGAGRQSKRLPCRGCRWRRDRGRAGRT